MFARVALLSVLAFVGFASAASAATVAYTKSTANLREGPGTAYDIITSLPKNSELLVEACTATWCAVVTEDDEEGFVAKSLLKKNPSGPDLPFSIQIIVGPEGPFVKFGDIFVEVEEPDDDAAEVCFYQKANFQGANFCVEDGDSDADIPGSFDNNIESILITGGLEVEVCSSANYGGQCYYFDKSQKTLPQSIRNKITSYVVGEGGNMPDDEDDEDFGNIIILN